MAEILSGIGFAVELTAQARDGGYDIVAIGGQIQSKYLIECKRLSKNRKVGVGIVRNLLGVVAVQEATKGIIVTTAPAFTRPANQFVQKVQWRLEGRAFDGLVEWLDLYQKFRMAKCIGVSVPVAPPD